MSPPVLATVVFKLREMTVPFGCASDEARIIKSKREPPGIRVLSLSEHEPDW